MTTSTQFEEERQGGASPINGSDNKKKNDINNEQRRIMRILTVGDGDLTFSLALARAYMHLLQDDSSNFFSSSASAHPAPPLTLDITASTLLQSPQELCSTYRNSHEVLQELQERHNVPVLYGVDATKLHYHPLLKCNNNDDDDEDGDYNNKKETKSTKFHLVCFNHPHLGDAFLRADNNKNNSSSGSKDQQQLDESLHAKRHFTLLAHYFYSARQVIQSFQINTSSSDGDSGDNHDFEGGVIQLCLCGTQPQTWQMEQAAARNGLELFHTESTIVSMDRWLSEQVCHLVPTTSSSEDSSTAAAAKANAKDANILIQSGPVEPHFAAPRRYRNGKLGSKHFLGRYGYRHRRTHGDLHRGNETDVNVTGSYHYLFRPITKTSACRISSRRSSRSSLPTATLSSPSLECEACGAQFGSKGELAQHWEAPAIPDAPKITASPCVVDDDNEGGGGDNDEVDGKNEIENKKNDEGTITRTTEQVCHAELRSREHFVAFTQEGAERGWTVQSIHDGKRLRWFLKNALFRKTKKQCDALVKDRQLLINGTVVLEKNRTLRANDTVIITSLEPKNAVTSPQSPTAHRAGSSTGEDPADATPISDEMNINAGVELVATPSLPLSEHEGTIVVAFKPVGMRTKGAFSDQTLEMVVTAMKNREQVDETRRTEQDPDGNKDGNFFYTSLSKMDKGCPGLCVLQKKRPRGVKASKVSSTAHLKVSHIFTALVHGSFPEKYNEGLWVDLHVVETRRRRKGGKKNEQQECAEQDATVSRPNDKGFRLQLNGSSRQSLEKVPPKDDVSVTYSSDCDGDGVTDTDKKQVWIKCVGRIQDLYGSAQPDGTLSTPPPLCTLELLTSTDASGALCLLLRRLGFPVVNDRFSCQQDGESASMKLPRSMRNLIKRRLCIGCYEVRIEKEGCWTHIEKMDPPERLLTSHWQAHMRK